MLREASELSGISERNCDAISESEVLNSGFEEICPPPRPIQQHEFHIGSPEGHYQSRHSPAAAEIAPALTGHGTSGCIVGLRMGNMGQELSRAEKAPALAVAKHGEQAVIRC